MTVVYSRVKVGLRKCPGGTKFWFQSPTIHFQQISPTASIHSAMHWESERLVVDIIAVSVSVVIVVESNTETNLNNNLMMRQAYLSGWWCRGINSHSSQASDIVFNLGCI